MNWLWWSLLLFFQNFAFTYVSRARSSGSIIRHIKAACASNLIWFISQAIMLGPMYDNITGKHGHLLQIQTALVYTVSTVTGSIVSHVWALRTEKGKSAVGASKLYAQIPVAEWEETKRTLAQFKTYEPKLFGKVQFETEVVLARPKED